MNDEESQRLKEKLLTSVPEDGPPMQFVPGRYYLGMWYVELRNDGSRFGHGGNWQALVWRKDEEPNVWHMLGRIRHYADSKIHGSQDERSWFQAKDTCDEKTIEKKTQEFADAMNKQLGKGVPTHFWELRGDYTTFTEATYRPYYMHMEKLDG